MVVRPAESKDDIQAMITETLALRKRSYLGQTGFACTAEDLAKWYLSQSMTDLDFCLYVAEEQEKIVGGCGGFMANLYVPPKLRYVTEWTWWGTQRALVLTWRAVEEWGAARGAVLSSFGKQEPPREIVEWRAL